MSKMAGKMRIVPGRIPFTRRKLVIAGAIAACAPAMTASAQSSESGPGNIEWSIQQDGTSPDASKVQLRIDSRWGENSRSTWGNDRPISELQGLSPGQVTGPDTPVRFALVRDAGRLDCSGRAGNLSGRGTCSFTVDPRFASYLKERGIGSPSPRQAFTLTMS